MSAQEASLLSSTGGWRAESVMSCSFHKCGHEGIQLLSLTLSGSDGTQFTPLWGHHHWRSNDAF